MQEWMIAMLVISVLLVLRDMAKTFFRGRSFRKAEQPEQEKNPQKGEGRAVCGVLSEACRQLLRTPLQEGLLKQRAGGFHYPGSL